MTLKNSLLKKLKTKVFKELGLKKDHQVPKVIKVNVNRGLGEAIELKALEAL